MLENIFSFSFQILFSSVAILGGVIVGKIFEKWTLRFFEKIKLKTVLKRMGGEEVLAKLWENFEIIKFFAKIVKWFFILLFLMVAFDILGLEKVASFLETILRYYPNIFIAILIFLIAVYLLDFSKKIFVGTLEKEKISFSPLVNRGLSLLIWVLTIFAILYQLKIVPELILVLFVGIVIIFSLALGLSFGLAGKDFVFKFLKELQEKMKK